MGYDNYGWSHTGSTTGYQGMANMYPAQPFMRFNFVLYWLKHH